MYDRAVGQLDLPDGLAEKIKVCDVTGVARFGARLRGRIPAGILSKLSSAKGRADAAGGIE